MKTFNKAGALAIAIAASALLGGASGDAHAGSISMPSNGTQSCRSTTAAGASSFYYNHTYLWNGGGTNQYLTCVLPEWNKVAGGTTTILDMSWAASGTGGTVTCTAQMGAFYFGVNHIDQGATVSLTLAPGGSGFLDFPDMVASVNWHTINVICNVPPGFKLGLIERHRFVPDTW